MNWKVIFTVFVVPAILMACAGTPDVSEQQLSSTYANVSPAEAFRQADQLFTQARLDELAEYSPEQFALASMALDKARKIVTKSPNDKQLLKYTYVFTQYLNKAKRIRVYTEDNLREIYAQKTILENIDVNLSHAKVYRKILRDLDDLVKDIEETQAQNKTNKSDIADNNKTRDYILARMSTLEISVVKFNTLNVSRKKLAQAEDDNAVKLANSTYTAAERALGAAEKFIAGNIKDKQGIKQLGDEFTFAVDHVVLVAAAVKRLQTLKKKNYEAYVLQNEQHLLEVSNALGHIDSRDKPVTKQVELLVTRAEAMVAASRLSIQTANESKVAETNLQTKLDSAHQALAKVKEEFARRVAILQIENKDFEARVAELKLTMQVMARAAIPTQPAGTPASKSASRSQESVAAKILQERPPVDVQKALESPSESGRPVETAAVEDFQGESSVQTNAASQTDEQR